MLMSRNLIPCLGLALGAAMIAGAPAVTEGAVTAAVMAQAQGATTGAATADRTQPRTADDAVVERVEEAWAGNRDLANADLEARMDGTRLVIEGEVATAAQRQTAERLARRVKGVSSLDNRIAIRMTASGSTDREGTRGSVVAGDVKDTARTVGDKTEDALDKTGSAIGQAAEATKDAVVTGAKKTGEAVASVPGKIDETWITTKIAGKINADDVLEDVDVDVKVKKNVVTITGDVPSPELRDRVLRIARETEGVARVVDRMTVRRAPELQP
jgi:osmotically-inducible protein OsmY